MLDNEETSLAPRRRHQLSKKEKAQIANKLRAKTETLFLKDAGQVVTAAALYRQKISDDRKRLGLD